MEKIWLASKSPRRAELLTRLGLEYEILTAEVDETVDGEPSACVETLAKRKADAGAEKAGAGWVLAADTLVFLDGKALGKPEDEQDAKRMLRALSGRTHQVLTGMCLKNAATGESFSNSSPAVSLSMETSFVNKTSPVSRPISVFITVIPVTLSPAMIAD